MWFKNLTVYRMTSGWAIDRAALEAALEAHAFTEPMPTQAASHGWVHTMDSAYAHAVNGQLLITLKTEKKSVPASAIKQEVAKAVERIEAEQGRKPGKKERREIKDEVLFTLLPKAIPVPSMTRIWIDVKHGWIAVDSASDSRADLAISSLVRAIDKLQLQTLYLARSAGEVMTEWLSLNDGPVIFSIDRGCELQAMDESKAKVIYRNQHLDTDDVKTHIKQGKRVKKLALTWNDRVSFVLTEKFRFNKVTALDILQEERDPEALDGDFVLMTSELSQMLTDLIQAFGGEAPRE